MPLIRTLKHYASLCLVLLGSVTVAYSQCSTGVPCETTIDEPFTGGQGSFSLGEGFTYNANQLQSQNRGGQNPRTLDILHSGYFRAPATGSVLTYKFTIGAQNQGGSVTSYRILARYGIGTNDVVLLCSGGALAAGSPCFNYTVASALAGKKFRFEFIFSFTGNNNQARIAFDNFSTNAAVAENQIPLPVTFTGFEGRKTAKGIQLTWQVADEVKVKAYEVERSNSRTAFERIGSLPATGASSYSFTDATPGSGTVIYRIKNVDYDGAFKYSTLISFQSGVSAVELRVLPTVVTTKTTVEHNAANGTESITLSTSDGRVMRSLHPQAGAVKTTVDMGNLPQGLYLLKWSDGSGAVQNFKVIKQ